MADSYTSGKGRKLLFASLLIVGITGAYQLGALWSGATAGQSANASTEVVKLKSKDRDAPKTIDFQLNNGVVNAWDISPFHLIDTDGEVHSLSDWKGKLILLNFWATWCPPCRYEIPEFIEYQDKYGVDGLQVIGVGIGEEKPIRNFARTYEMNYPVLITADSQIMLDWGNTDQILPYSVLINRDGRIQYIHRGQLGRLSFKYEVEPFIKASKTAGK